MIISPQRSDNFQATVEATPQLPASKESPNQVRYLVTKTHGRDETGITVMGDDGTGVYFPESTTEPSEGRPINARPGVNVSTLYPQWAETDSKAGQSLAHIRKAANCLQEALDAQCGSDAETRNQLVLAEVELFQALQKIEMNKPFEMAISFCAWAVKNASLTSPFPSLQSMISALRRLLDEPFIGTQAATHLVLDLHEQGWQEDSPISQALDHAFDQALGNAAKEFFF